MNYVMYRSAMLILPTIFDFLRQFLMNSIVVKSNEMHENVRHTIFF